MLGGMFRNDPYTSGVVTRPLCLKLLLGFLFDSSVVLSSSSASREDAILFVSSDDGAGVKLLSLLVIMSGSSIMNENFMPIHTSHNKTWCREWLLCPKEETPQITTDYLSIYQLSRISMSICQSLNV
mmetsp:Transcript_18137/g.20970  ORF Transcript_18137/g.20970 Transcript_18137/m.20970 type:complete len:127 (+) Transcript_18137:886-1266(+)